MKSQLYFWRPLMDMHKKELAIVKEYYTRTKPQFENIEEEAEQYARQLYNSNEFRWHVDSDVAAEWAHERGLETYDLLLVMKSNHLCMTISMLYHIWEQQLIRFTIRELEHCFQLDKRSLVYSDVQKVFSLHGISICDTNAWNRIRELKFLVNVIKHGDGDSAEKLRKVRPGFFHSPITDTDTLRLRGTVLIDAYSIQIDESDLFEYIGATQRFWDEMPERAYSDVEAIMSEFSKKAN